MTDVLARLIAATSGGYHADHAFVDPSARIGSNVKVWHYARILADVTLCNGVSIGGGTEIGRGSTIGDRSRIGANCFLPAETMVGENVFVGPGCTFTDDKYPRVNNADYEADPPRIGNRASIGAGCVFLPGVVIGDDAMIGAGSVVTEDVPAECLAYGNPARVMGFNPNRLPNLAP